MKIFLIEMLEILKNIKNIRPSCNISTQINFYSIFGIF